MDSRKIKRIVVRVTISIIASAIFWFLKNIFSPSQQTWSELKIMITKNSSIIIVLIGIIVIAGMWIYWWLKDQKEKQTEKEKKQTGENSSYRDRIRDELLRQLKLVNDLWEKHNALHREFSSTKELVGMMNRTGSITTRAITGYINSLKSEEHIISAVDSLYGKCTIPELKEIGLSGSVIHLMEARYYAEKLGEAEANIELSEPKPKEEEK